MDKNFSIFYPYASEQLHAAQRVGGRFAYYTSADVAVSVLQKRQLWMRNTRLMNDFRETEHGFECLQAARSSDLGRQFDHNLDQCIPGLSSEVHRVFDAWMPAIKADTYITCLSVHPHWEDAHGRLSMWRAYGGKAGVAIVIKSQGMFDTAINSGIVVSPVAYFTAGQFLAEFESVVRNIGANAAYLRELGRAQLTWYIFSMFRAAVLCTKHPAFEEEKEWRIISSPSMYPPLLTTEDIEIVRGTPQRVLKLNLVDRQDLEIDGLDISQILDRIIIGPCEFPDITYQAFFRLLESLNVREPANKIWRSNIPLRHF